VRWLTDRLPDSIDARVRAAAWASLLVQIGIVGTGGAVRLTGSGLGCPTWPRCTADTYVVRPEQGMHGLIEFGNRMLTFVLAAVAVVAVLAVLKLRRQRPDLFRLSMVLAAGIPAQAALGGLTVLTGLNPWLVGAHFVVSAALVSVATAFVFRTSSADGWVSQAPRPLVALAWGTATSVVVAVLLGVVTTGAGPHAGDAATPRNGLDLEVLQHLHSYPGYLMLVLTMGLTIGTLRPGFERLRPLVLGLLVAELVQIGVGISQARLGVPPMLVGLHMLLACAVVSLVTACLLAVGRGR